MRILGLIACWFFIHDWKWSSDVYLANQKPSSRFRCSRCNAVTYKRMTLL